MESVHWWALAGLVWMRFGTWMFAQAHGQAQTAAADRVLLRRQLSMFSEVLAIMEYGADDEAHELLEEIDGTFTKHEEKS